jgi:hypothetical protein
MENFELDTTYVDLMSAVIPAGIPEEILIMVADEVIDVIPIEQARFLLGSIWKFDEEFGPGKYMAMTMAMIESLHKAMAAMTPDDLILMSIKVAEMQGVDLPFGPPKEL